MFFTLSPLSVYTCVITRETFNSFFLPGDRGGAVCVTTESFTPGLLGQVHRVSMDDQASDSDLEE